MRMENSNSDKRSVSFATNMDIVELVNDYLSRNPSISKSAFVEGIVCEYLSLVRVKKVIPELFVIPDSEKVYMTVKLDVNVDKEIKILAFLYNVHKQDVLNCALDRYFSNIKAGGEKN